MDTVLRQALYYKHTKTNMLLNNMIFLFCASDNFHFTDVTGVPRNDKYDTVDFSYDMVTKCIYLKQLQNYIFYINDMFNWYIPLYYIQGIHKSQSNTNEFHPINVFLVGQSQWPCGLRHGLWLLTCCDGGFEFCLGMDVCCECQVEVSAIGWSLIQRSPNEWCVWPIVKPWQWGGTTPLICACACVYSVLIV
jgi:hypothetical protein